ncbi:TldD/PmbA family protein [Actibacterium ureilyticum]|uniref:TldD/PmbA family protein n=1 Tax=Actibacterium ureilyticum TaxID=1590614 RepID=UPI000BAAB816|nr:TldD/PmbA family protein [Actibacterium ureilyticum]
MARTPKELTETLIEIALEAGADAADAIAAQGTSVSIDVRKGALEAAERSEGVEIGLRVLLGQKQACVSASDTREDTMRDMAMRAIAMAREAPEDPFIGLADPDMLACDWDLAALELADPAPEPSAEALQEDARATEAAALNTPGITQVQAASAGYGQQQIHLAASNGFSGGYARTDRAISCVAIAGEGTGMERDYDSQSRVFQADLPSAAEIGQRAAERTLERMNPRKPRTGQFPVLFDERISSSLIGHILVAINGTSVARGSSWLRDSMGEQILPKGLSLTCDPLRPRISGSRPFDAEGLPTRAFDLITDGVLQSWVLDLATARQLGTTSNANAARSPSAPPSPRSGNMALTQGSRSRDELIADMGTGLLVTSLIGSSINPTTGDYSRGASGFWVENGQITHAVNECTLAGNLHQMLKTLQPANDARMHLSRIVPSVLIEGLTIAGE